MKIRGTTITTPLARSAVADDTSVSKKTWSSKNTVDKLCPTFTESGSVVNCEPVEGYPLGVVSKIVPEQSGDGTPSPENVRPMTGRTAVTLSISNETDEKTFSCDLGQTVYGGYLNWQTGKLTINTKKVMLRGVESWNRLTNNPNGTVFSSYDIGGFVLRSDSNYIGHFFGVSSHFVKSTYALSGSSPGNSFYWSASDGNLRVVYGLPNGGTTVDEFNQFLAEQYANGTPVEIVAQIQNPTTVQLTPQEIIALSGVNTLYSDTGDTEVTGKSNPSAIIEKLTNAIISLGGNV